MTVKEFKSWAINELSAGNSPCLDADVLLSHFLEKDRTWLLLHRDEIIGEQKLLLLKQAVQERKKGLPVAYITGFKEFYKRKFIVTPDVLIPKPDTEILVENAIDLILARLKSDRDCFINIIDVCTGSGCIGLSVAAEVLEVFPDADIRLTMTDISLKALEVCRQNCAAVLGTKANAAELVQGDLFCGRRGFNFILTNPPYIPKKMVDELLLDGRNEPRLALDGDTDTAVLSGVCLQSDKDFGLTDNYCREFITVENTNADTDGLSIVRRLFVQAKNACDNGAVILCETGEYNARAAAAFAKENGFQDVKILKDLEGQDRVVYATLSFT